MEKVIICRGSSEDRDDMLDFANYVFSQSLYPHDFIRDVPRLYAKGQNTEQYHYLIKENGKIKAMLCALPLILDVSGQKLKMNFIGTVSVHPYARGKGYMTILMEKMLEEARESGCVFSALGGLRHRYGYYGYEKGGVKININITATNIQHCCKNVSRKFSFREIKEEDHALMDMILELHHQQEIKVIRSQSDLFPLLHAWNSVPYAIFEDGTVTGYLVLGENNLIEIRLTEEELLPLVLKSLFTAKNLNSINLAVAGYEVTRLSYLFDIIENYNISISNNYRIFNYSSFIEAFLCAKAKTEKLMDGEFRLEIEDKQIHLMVADGKVNVSEEKDSVSKSNVILDSREAVSFLTSSLSTKRSIAQINAPFLQNWFPLPLLISEMDAC